MPLGSVIAKNDILKDRFGSSRNTEWPATIWLALFNNDPTTTGTELTSTGGYVRSSVDNTDSMWSTSSGHTTNLFAIFFPVATGAYSSAATYWGFYDASSGGNLLDTGKLVDTTTGNPISITVVANQSIIIPINQLILTQQ